MEIYKDFSVETVTYDGRYPINYLNIFCTNDAQWTPNVLKNV